MKFIITGSTGHISKPLAQHLAKAGHDITVVSSSKDKSSEIESIGARPAIGSLEDLAFLTRTFQGADAVYTMIPPKMDAENWKAFIHQIAGNYTKAIQSAGVKRSVHLSSIGAEVREGGGLLSIYYGVEQMFNALDSVHVTFLRPGSFYTNFYGNIDMIKQYGVIGNNYGELLVPLADPHDIAQAAWEELLAKNPKDKSVRYVVSDERLTNEIAKVLGTMIGKPDLPWVKFKDEDLLNGMVQNGVSADVANNLVLMGNAVERGETLVDYSKNKPTFGAIKLEDFAKEFAVAYRK